ncbi:early nodulin-like protein 1 [Panicum virgatum]|uniref:Phytocyanin domain-containing protein n=1 Tax=Panicum virgatum TaxID=38727 RepID=A0A8T0X0U5_PANVG|nr:early nodulin-like protein 1 [Panicum virgatum]KAG2652378.1 hypothetical protein PVAP13_1NG351100 [Panicum virgatum]
MASAAGIVVSSRALPVLAIAGAVLVAAPGASATEAAAAPRPAPLEFRVGGPRGWRVPDANTSYIWWATNNRFHVGDRLLFKYAQDSVLVVDRPAFDACNATEPLAAFSDGATTVRLDRPGFFCFISSEPGHCQQGQRLMVRVMVHPAGLAAAAPAPGILAQPGGRPRPSSGCASSAAAEWVAAAASVAVMAAMAVLVGLL